MPPLTQRFHALLRWSERYTKTDMVYLAQGGFWIGLGQVCAALTSFALSLAVARYLTPETYGSYKYLISFGLIVGAFSLTGLATATVQSVARGYEGILRSGFKRSLLWSWPAALTLFAAAGYYVWNGNLEFGVGCMIIGLSMPLINAGSLYSSFLNGKKLFREGSLIWCIGNVVSVGSLIAAAFFWHSVLAMIITYFAVNAVMSLLSFLFVLKKHRPNALEDKESSSFDLHISAINLLGTIANNTDKIIVFQMLGPASLAIYTFAAAIPDQIRGLLKSGSLIALPRFAERDFSHIQSTLGGKLVRFAILITLAAAAYAAASPFIFAFLFPGYLAAVPYSQILALSMFTVLASVPVSALQAHRKTRSLYTYTIVNSLGQIGLTVVLVFFFGLWGAVGANIGNRLIGIVLSYTLFAREKQAR